MFSILDENPVVGYLAGWDQETYFVVYDLDDEVFKMLIPKLNILNILLFDEGSFREEPRYEEMNKIVRPFRDMINATYFEQNAE